MRLSHVHILASGPEAHHGEANNCQQDDKGSETMVEKSGLSQASPPSEQGGCTECHEDGDEGREVLEELDVSAVGILPEGRGEELQGCRCQTE